MKIDLSAYRAAKKKMDERANEIRREALIRFYRSQGHQMAKAVELANKQMKEVE